MILKKNQNINLYILSVQNGYPSWSSKHFKILYWVWSKIIWKHCVQRPPKDPRIHHDNNSLIRILLTSYVYGCLRRWQNEVWSHMAAACVDFPARIGSRVRHTCEYWKYFQCCLSRHSLWSARTPEWQHGHKRPWGFTRT